jgi:predicted site-specific integrase-resolvase
MTDSIFQYTEPQAASLLGISCATLRSWRRMGRVAHYALPSGRVRYQLSDLIELQRNLRVPAQNVVK